LQLEEAVDAIAAPSEPNTRFDPQDRMPDACEIAAVCSSLVAVVGTHYNHGNEGEESDDEESTEREPATETKIQVNSNSNGRTTELRLQLAHFSVKEYLISGRIENDFEKHLQESAARSTIARVSLVYLLSLSKGLEVS
jgi:hypothetical protein